MLEPEEWEEEEEEEEGGNGWVDEKQRKLVYSMDSGGLSNCLFRAVHASLCAWFDREL